MNLGELRAAVYKVCEEVGYTTTDVDQYINECIEAVSQTISLPELKGIDTVSTVASTAYCSLSSLTDGFSGRLLRVVNASGEVIKQYPYLELFMDAYGLLTEAGDVEAVCLEGSVLWYQKIPATPEVLTVMYIKNHSPLVDDSDELTLFPEYLQRDLFVAGAAYIIFDQLEDGIDGEKINTAAQLAKWNRGLTGMRAYVARRRPHYISSTWSV